MSRMQLELPLAAVGRRRAFLRASAPGARRDRFRGSHRPSDGAAAPAVQSRAARSQRAQHPARHPVARFRAGAGSRPHGGANDRLGWRPAGRCARGAPPRLSGLRRHHAGGPACRRPHGECLTTEGAFGNPGSSSHDHGEAAQRWSRPHADRWQRPWARSRPTSSGRRARPKRTTSPFSASRSYYREQGMHIVTARTEHKAVLDPCRELERRGWRVTYLEPDRDGVAGTAAESPPRCAPRRCWCHSCTSTTKSASSRTSPPSRARLPRTAGHACTSMRRRASASAPWSSRARAPTSCPCRRTRPMAPRASGRSSLRAAVEVQLQALQFGGGQERSLRPGTVRHPSGGGHGRGLCPGGVGLGHRA